LRIPRLLLPVALGLVAVLLMGVSLTYASAPETLSTTTRVPANIAPTPAPFITIEAPILVYHSVGSAGKGLNVTAQDFAAQMDWLQQNGYTSVSLDQVAAALRGQATLPPRPVALTFDDGWAHVYTNVVPALQAHGFRGTFFVIAGYGSGRSPTFLSWDQIKAMRDAGMWIGAHSFTHPRLNGLDAMGLRHEVVDAKAEIEKHIGGPVTVFAYPYGGVSPRVMQAAQEAGYVAAVVISPRVQQRSDQIYRLNRITMSTMTMAQFKLYLTGGKVALPPLPQRLLHPFRDEDAICRRWGC